MALARLLNAGDVKPARSILFAAFSGEEAMGKGSSWFVGHSPIPVGQIRLVLNVGPPGDDVGARDHRLEHPRSVVEDASGQQAHGSEQGSEDHHEAAPALHRESRYPRGRR